MCLVLARSFLTFATDTLKFTIDIRTASTVTESLLVTDVLPTGGQWSFTCAASGTNSTCSSAVGVGDLNAFAFTLGVGGSVRIVASSPTCNLNGNIANTINVGGTQASATVAVVKPAAL